MAQELILVVEDEKNIAELVQYNLEQAGYLIHVIGRGDHVVDWVRSKNPHLIILDLMLPGMNGLEICKTLKNSDKTKNIPIVMLTAKSEEVDKVIGLELGADDYMTKPFSPRELVARVKAVLRRGNEKPTERVLTVGELQIECDRHRVLLKGKPIELTSKEYDLLVALMEADGRALSRDFLLSKVWGYERSLNLETRTVDMHIGQLRKKIKTEGMRIVTIKNVGYRFDSET